MSEMLHLSDEGFESDVLQSELPVLVDFWAPWCGPCRMLSPLVEDLSSDYEGKLVFAKMNTDECPATPGQYGIMSIPSLLIFKGGQVVDRTVGMRPRGALKEWIDGALEA